MSGSTQIQRGVQVDIIGRATGRWLARLCVRETEAIVVYSQQTARWYGGDNPRERVEHHLLGIYHALIEARIPFDMVMSLLKKAPTIAKGTPPTRGENS